VLELLNLALGRVVKGCLSKKPAAAQLMADEGQHWLTYIFHELRCC
jgi:hypothetical protein